MCLLQSFRICFSQKQIAVISKNVLKSDRVPLTMALLFPKPDSNSIYLMFAFNITKEMSYNFQEYYKYIVTVPAWDSQTFSA